MLDVHPSCRQQPLEVIGDKPKPLMSMWMVFALLLTVMLAVDLGMNRKSHISFILAFVGGKMLVTAGGFHVPVAVSLGIILVTLLSTVLASVVVGRNLLNYRKVIDSLSNCPATCATNRVFAGRREQRLEQIADFHKS